MDPIKNPFSPGAGSPPPELAGRDPILEQARVLLGRINRTLSTCSLPGCCDGASRREFLKLVGAGAAVAAGAPAMAGPFQTSDLEQLVPADKKLSPE